MLFFFTKVSILTDKYCAKVSIFAELLHKQK